MKTSPAIDLYWKMYVEPRFERTALFTLLRQQFACESVLYPGCSIHIAPSFVFPHVVYVDRSPEAIQFFADTAAIQAYIDSKKKYKRSAYFRFIAQDYTLPLEEQSFDLLLALFAGVISSVCKPYLKTGGLLVTNNSQGDAQQAANDPDFQLMAVVRYQKKNYMLVKENPELILAAANRDKTKHYLKQTSCGVQYTEEEDYFVFQKRPVRVFN